MSLRPIELEQVCEELSARLVGANVQKAFAPLPRLAYLELRQPGRTITLCASAEPELSRISITRGRLPSPGEPQSLQRFLRNELVGLAFVGAARHDRSISLRFTRDEVTRILWLELSAGGLLVLTSAEGRVLAVSGEGGKRGVFPGATFPPDETRGTDTRGTDARTADARESSPSRLTPIVDADFPVAEAAEQLYASVERTRRADAIRRRLALPYRARLSRLDRTLGKVRAEAGREPEAEEHRRVGELLSQNLFRIPRGAKTVTLNEYTEEGARELEVTLDPKRSPKDEVAWHFHQYRRLTRGLDHAKHRLLELERDAESARVALSQIEAMGEDRLLAQLEVLAAPSPTAQPGKAVGYREHTSASGHRIWVGKHAEGNDELTFKLARPHHVWLHARGVPGSHVVVVLQKGETLSQETLLDAAHLALHHSDLKGEPRGEVSYVPVRYVRKVKDGHPGQVHFTQEKTFVVRVEPERLKRLLELPATSP